MCLITKQREPIILKKDIIVYKSFRPLPFTHITYSIFSEYQDYEYEFDKLYETNIEESLNDPCPLDDIVTDYYNLKSIRKRVELNRNFNISITEDIVKSFNANGLKVFEKGFHFFSNKQRATGIQINECIIPKGSEIYYDKTRLGISNKIIVTRKQI